MALPVAFLDELRARTLLSALIARSVVIKRQGREWKGCCPFHSEKTPSFTVNDDKGFWHCFGCSAHGDAIRWMTEYHGLGFIDAVRELAAAAGMDVPAPSPEAAARAERIDGIRPALEAAQALYARELEQTGAAREYLMARGVDDAAIARFGLGWAPGRRGHLRDLGIDFATALSAGLAWSGDDKSGETFYLRLMVPVHDGRGRIVGFGGRSLTASSLVPKYKNSPDSEIFDKGRLLFNLHRAISFLSAGGGEGGLSRRQADAAGENSSSSRVRRLIIVEGYFDVIALDRVGIGEAVAPMGTALTPQQIELAWRQVACPTLAFDGDTAGRTAARRACETALPMIGAGRSLSVALFPPGQDPDDVVRGAGDEARNAVEAVLCDAVPMARFLFDAVLSDAGVTEGSPEAVAGVWVALERLLASIVDAETREQYRALWRGRFDAEVSLAARLRPVAEQVTALIEADEGKYAFPDDRDESQRKLKMITDRLLRLRADRTAISEDIKSVLSIGKAFGFSTRQLTAVVRDLEADPAVREEGEAIHVSYRRALGVQGPLTEALLPAIGEEAVTRAAKVMDKRLSRTLALIDARDVSNG